MIIWTLVRRSCIPWDVIPSPHDHDDAVPAGADAEESGCYTPAMNLACPNLDTSMAVYWKRVRGIHLAAFAFGLVEGTSLAVGVDWCMLRPSYQGRLESIVLLVGIPSGGEWCLRLGRRQRRRTSCS